jgi:3-deoxy-D-manno-octulosonic-acid transferase
VLRRLEAWGQTQRDPARRLLWMHAPSVGEGLQAEAVLRVLKARHPEWQVAYTHFSPSAAPLAARQDVDIADYLPWDTPGSVRRALDALRPTALVFAKLDLWPELACQAAGQGIGAGLIAGTVSPVSGRLRWPARALLRPGYAALTAAGAIAQADADLLAALVTPPDRILVLGDPRFDSALQVIDATAPDEPTLRFKPGPPVLVAGSTWPADEGVLLQAFAEVRRVHPEARLILAPHEPSSAHLVGIRAAARKLGLPDPDLLDAALPDSSFVLVDRVGVLARLYGSGAMAIVGGGFGRAGLHSVVEPAGWALPVCFGPHWQDSREAGLLAEAGGATVLDQADPARHLAFWWSRMLAERGEREAAGRKAAAVIDAGRGAAVRQAELVERLMGGRVRGQTGG